MTRYLSVREPSELTPEEVVAGATTQARLLWDIVEKTKCFQEISGKKYLQVEAWETIGSFNRTHAETESIAPILKDNETIGYQARVQLWKDGVVVGGAIMPCYFTENCCKGKESDAKHKSCMSAAQTFATSKAYRMNFSYVAILAGYEPTPAEEMTGTASDERPANLEHWCETHQTKFFKRGKMKWWAHKIEGTENWCAEDKVNKQTKKEPVVVDESQAARDIEAYWPESGQPIEEQVAELAEPVKEKPETEVAPTNIQQFYNWLQGKGKKYTRSWFMANSGIDESTLLNPEGVKAAYEWVIKEVV